MQNRSYASPQGQYQQDTNAQYGQVSPQAPPMYSKPNEQTFVSDSGKQDFNQSFAITKPKWNDLWAAVLFALVFAGFVVVSGLALHGYSNISHGGIYQSGNGFGLNGNTIILL